MHKNRTAGGDSASPTRLGLLTALSLACTLVYVFLLLVPTWRTVHVNRALIGACLANQSKSGQDSSGLWDALERDPLLHSRSANAFRECLTAEDFAYNATTPGGLEIVAKNNSLLESHLLESLAGVYNASKITGGHSSSGRRRPNPGSDRCWFLDMHWSLDGNIWNLMTASHHAVLRCIRALFLLAVCLLLCYCVSLTCSLYACFAYHLAAPCRLLLLAAHGLSLSQLVALAILQDVSVQLAVARLLDLLAAAGFPSECANVVGGARGVCSLVLFCILCLACALQMLLLVVPITWDISRERRKIHRRQDFPITPGTSTGAGGEKEEGEKAARECDNTEDTKPLI